MQIVKNSISDLNLFGTAYALVASYEMGLLQAIVKNPNRTASWYTMESTSVDVDAVEKLLGILWTLGVVGHDPGKGDYWISERFSFLDDILPGGLLSDIAIWVRMKEYAENGEDSFDYDTAQSRDVVYEKKAFTVEKLYRDAAIILAKNLKPAQEQVLEIGAGSGVWGRAMIEALHPKVSCTVTFLDLPQVIAKTQANMPPKLTDRCHFVACDYHHIDLERRYDTILIANVLHLENPPDAELLLQGWIKSLLSSAPDAQVVIVDSFDMTDPIGHALYKVHLGMRHKGGHVHSMDQFTIWAQSAGLKRSHMIQLGDPEVIKAMVFRR